MKRNIPILMYHSISHPIKNTPFKCLHLPPRRFAFQMWLLKILGYQGLSMAELVPYLKGEKTGKVVGITFDDGYQNNLHIALPILQKYGFSATCYLVTGCVGQHNIWDESKNIPKNPLMNKDEITKWIQAGMEVAPHTHNHVSLTDVDDDKAWQEILTSKAYIEQEFGQNVQNFCYPYGKFSVRHMKMLSQMGFTTATAMYRGRCIIFDKGLSDDDLLALPRVTVNNNCYLHIFLLKLLTNYEDNKGQCIRAKHRQELNLSS